jgi:hypothetical protein
MSKKTFVTAPRPKQPTADEIDAFEKGGVGHDQAVPPPAERSKRLSLDLPESVHTRFKTACSATGRKMVSEIQAFIERRAAELESEGGISRK